MFVKNIFYSTTSPQWHTHSVTQTKKKRQENHEKLCKRDSETKYVDDDIDFSDILCYFRCSFSDFNASGCCCCLALYIRMRSIANLFDLREYVEMNGKLVCYCMTIHNTIRVYRANAGEWEMKNQWKWTNVRVGTCELWVCVSECVCRQVLNEREEKLQKPILCQCEFKVLNYWFSADCAMPCKINNIYRFIYHISCIVQHRNVSLVRCEYFASTGFYSMQRQPRKIHKLVNLIRFSLFFPGRTFLFHFLVGSTTDSVPFGGFYERFPHLRNFWWLASLRVRFRFSWWLLVVGVVAWLVKIVVNMKRNLCFHYSNVNPNNGKKREKELMTCAIFTYIIYWIAVAIRHNYIWFYMLLCCVALLLYLIYNIQIHVRTFYCFDADPPTFDGRTHCCRWMIRFREHIDDKSHSWQHTFCFIRHRNHAWMDSYQIISWYATIYTHTIRSMYGWNIDDEKKRERESEKQRMKNVFLVLSPAVVTKLPCEWGSYRLIHINLWLRLNLMVK